ncbi:hypothetical protein GQR36_07300 [Enterococcus termitis]
MVLEALDSIRDAEEKVEAMRQAVKRKSQRTISKSHSSLSKYKRLVKKM